MGSSSGDAMAVLETPSARRPPDDPNTSFSAVKTAPAGDSGRGDAPLTAESYRDMFFAILNNGTKVTKAPPDKRRSRGFVVLTRHAESLQPLQSLCFDGDRTITRCLTARYRLRSGPVFGTLLQAVASDLLMIAQSGPDTPLAGSRLRGELLPAVDGTKDGTAWARLFPDEQLRSVLQDAAQPGDPTLGTTGSPGGKYRAGEVDREWLGRLLGTLESLLRPSDRLVIFCEVAGDPGSSDDWEAARSIIFERLPERMGLVLSGPPDDFELPKAAKQNVDHFVLSAWKDDRPASEDQLELGRFAEAFARLVLLPASGPFTAGITAPWGQGKSSFMNLIKAALNQLSAERTRPDLTAKISKLDEEIEALNKDLRNALADSHSADRADPAPLASAKGQVEARLEQERDERVGKRDGLRNRAEHESRREVLLVDFNAWRYQDSQQIWAGLAARVTDKVEKALPRRARWWAPLRYMFDHHRLPQLALGVLVPSVIAAAVAALAFAVGFGKPVDKMTQHLPALGQALQILLPVGSVVFTLWFVAWRVYRVVQPVSQRVLDYARLPEYGERLGFQEQVLSDLGFLNERLKAERWRWKRVAEKRWPWERVPGTKGLPWALKRQSRVPRIVVFIDDLDRCSYDKIREILANINLILGESGSFVFLAMDMERILAAVMGGYPNGASTEVAENYMDKILQLRFRMPSTPAEGRASLVASLFSQPTVYLTGTDRTPAPTREGGPSASAALGAGPMGFDLSLLTPPRVVLQREIEDTPAELRAFADLSGFLPDNPREIKRLVNLHRLIKILLQTTERPFDADQQRELVAWVVFCLRWPLREEEQNPFARLSRTRDREEVLRFLEQVKRDGKSLLAGDFVDGSLFSGVAAYMQRFQP